MGDRNPPTFADASRRYTALRRRCWRFLFGGVMLFAVPGTALIAFGPLQRFVFYELLVRTLQIGFVVCCLGCLIQWHCLMQFICPRCSMRFVRQSPVALGGHNFGRIAVGLNRRRPDIPLLVVEARGTSDALAKLPVDRPGLKNLHRMAYSRTRDSYRVIG